MPFPGDYEAIAQARAANELASIKNAVTNMPPGFYVGGELTIHSDDKLLMIGSVIANIHGRLVRRTVPYQITEDNYVGQRTNETQYYLYLSMYGDFYVTTVEPADVEGEPGEYHPEHGWLYIGGFYIDSDGKKSQLVSRNAVTFSSITVPDGAITTDMLAAGAITAEKLAADAISGDTLDINDIISTEYTEIDGGAPGDSVENEYDGGTDLSAEADETYNDDTGQYVDIHSNHITIHNPLFIKKGAVAALMKSLDYQEGQSGWKIDPYGDAEFNNGTFRGTLHAADGSFTGDLVMNLLQIIEMPDSSLTQSYQGGTYHHNPDFCDAGTQAPYYRASEVYEWLASKALPEETNVVSTGSTYDTAEVDYIQYGYEEFEGDPPLGGTFKLWWVSCYDDEDNLIDGHDTPDGFTKASATLWDYKPAYHSKDFCWVQPFSDDPGDLDLVIPSSGNKISFPDGLPEGTTGREAGDLFFSDNGDGTGTVKIKL